MAEATGRRARLRGGLANGLLVVGAVLFSLGVVEAVLRAWPALLGPAFANGVLTRYTTREGGIFYRDPNLRMNFMIPGLRTTMRYNGYSWTHEADALGFRGRRVAIPAHVVLLGDSFIYGHGVELESTVSHFLEQILGRAVANLARQGDSAYQEAYLLTTHIGLYQPRHVVYFYFENDVNDVASYLSEAAMRAFIDTPLEDIRYPPRMEVTHALRRREEKLASRPWHSTLARAYVVRAWKWQAWTRWNALPAPAAAPVGPVARATPLAGAPGGAPGNAPRAEARIGVATPEPAAGAPASDDPNSLGWRYTRKAIAYMKYVSAQHGARMLVVPITPTDARHLEIVRGIAAALDLPFLDTSALPRDPSLWLPGDGHFSPAGARRVAEMVAEGLAEQSPPGVRQ
jgi:hypothetical protein